MTLKRRINKLEGACATPEPNRPKIILLCAAETGEPGLAYIIGGPTLVRHEGESAAEFDAGACAYV